MTYIDNGTFYHIYDLIDAPTTFNCVVQLITGELARRELTDCTHTHLIFVPGLEENDYFNALDHYSSDVKKWRLGNIVLPAIDLFPSVKSFSFLQNRDEVTPFLQAPQQNIFPLGYTQQNQAVCGQSISPNLNFTLGYDIPSLQAPALAHEYVKRIVKRVCGDSKFITITLRQTDYNTARNSSMAIWQEVSDHFQRHGYKVILLPDYERVFDIEDDYFPNAYTCRECVLDLRLRFALYEQASLNLGQVGGPIACCPYNDRCNYVLTRLIVDGVGHSTPEFMQEMGFDVGKDNGFYDTFNRWLWTSEDENNIIDVCDEFIAADRSPGIKYVNNDRSPVAGFEAVTSLFGPDAAKLTFSKLGPAGPVFVNKERNEFDRQEHVIRHSNKI